jgi:arylsulfatase A-like enzyme
MAIRGSRGRGILALLLVPLAFAACVRQPAVEPQDAVPAAAPRERPPDVVVVLTDDQRWDTLWAMPTVQRELVDHGVTFTNAFVVNPLCCPSRASILTGRYSHGTGVYLNRGKHGGFNAFDDTSTVATWLDDAGYETALAGKYMNKYRDASYVPPGWDRWAAFLGPNGYYDYSLAVDGAARDFGSRVREYSTDVLARWSSRFIRSVPEDEPLFLMFAPYAPHKHAVPARRDEGTFDGFRRWRTPGYDETNVRDKPPYVRSKPRVRPGRADRLAIEARREYESLGAVDDAVGRLVEALEETGRLSTTLLVFMSDNGVAWGEHRWTYKLVPYEESIRVPMVVRFDPLVDQPRQDPNLVLNIDLAPTIGALSGIGARAMDGRSLVPLLDEGGGGAPWRLDFLIENLRFDRGGKDVVPTYCAVRSRRALYVAYRGGFEELYDLDRDPFQMRNVAGQNLPILDAMRARVAELCDPPPPSDPR